MKNTTYIPIESILCYRDMRLYKAIFYKYVGYHIFYYSDILVFINSFTTHVISHIIQSPTKHLTLKLSQFLVIMNSTRVNILTYLSLEEIPRNGIFGVKRHEHFKTLSLPSRKVVWSNTDQTAYSTEYSGPHYFWEGKYSGPRYFWHDQNAL